jgi:hypothetical protein
MEAIKFRTLETDQEIDYFINRFESYVGVKLPYDYSQRSEVIAGFKGNEMVCGYMLVTKPSYRSLMFIPDEVKNTHPFFKNDSYDMMEINGVWISASLKEVSEHFTVWMRMVWDILKCRKQYILLMANKRNTNIRNVHTMTGATDLYEGAPMLMAGDNSHASIRVSYTTRWAFVMNLPRYWLEYKRRERRSGRRNKQRVYSQTVKAG